MGHSSVYIEAQKWRRCSKRRHVFFVYPLFVLRRQCRQKKNIIKETNQKQLEVLREMSSWCLQDLGSSSNRTKVWDLVFLSTKSNHRYIHTVASTKSRFSILLISPTSIRQISRLIAVSSLSPHLQRSVPAVYISCSGFSPPVLPSSRLTFMSKREHSI